MIFGVQAMRIQNIGKIVATLLLLIPSAASAQIIISEIMYDAQGSDTDQEYVELFNAGSAAIDLSKWKFNDGSNHVLNAPPKNGGTGSITIQPGSYILLVDNATNFIALHSGISASIIDTVMTLPNASGTVSIINDSGVSEDSFSYTKDMGAAGDSNSLQKTSNGSWVAGSPTPGTGSSPSSSGSLNTNSTSDSSTSTTTTTTTTTTSSNNGGPVSSASSIPVEPQIFAYAGKDREAIAGADSIFEARAFNKNKEQIKPGRFLWTFGDGTSAEGQTVMHHFPQPGRYAVVLDIADSLYSASHQIIVAVLPVSISLSLRNDDIILSNKSSKNLDLSYWSLRSGGKIFLIPKNTILLGNASVPFTKEVTNLAVAPDAALLYPNGLVAGALGTVSPAPYLSGSAPSVKIDDVAQPVSDSPADSADAQEATSTGQPLVANAATAENPNSSHLWWFGVLGLIVVGGGAIVASRHAGKKEWNIIEESAE